MAGPNQATAQLYNGVIKDVVTNVREAFLDEGVDESVLAELKQIWELKVQSGGAVDLLGLGTAAGNAAAGGPSSKRARAVAAEKSVPRAYPGGPGAHIPLIRSIPNTVMSSSGTTLTDAAMAANLALPTVAQNVVTGQQVVHGGQRVIAIQPPPTGSVIQFGATAGVAGPPIHLLISRQEQAAVTQQSSVINAVRPKMEPPDPTPSLPQLDGPTGTTQDPQETEDLPGTSRDLLQENLEADRALKRKKRLRKKMMKNVEIVVQVDGPSGGGISDDDDDLEDSDDAIDDEADGENDEDDPDVAGPVEEGDPLNSDDDASSDDDAEVMFDADNVAVCQYDKVQRSKNKWKFVLKDGVMNLEGRDYVFSKATGEAEW